MAISAETSSFYIQSFRRFKNAPKEAGFKTLNTPIFSEEELQLHHSHLPPSPNDPRIVDNLRIEAAAQPFPPEILLELYPHDELQLQRGEAVTWHLIIYKDTYALRLDYFKPTPSAHWELKAIESLPYPQEVIAEQRLPTAEEVTASRQAELNTPRTWRTKIQSAFQSALDKIAQQKLKQQRQSTLLYQRQLKQKYDQAKALWEQRQTLRQQRVFSNFIESR